MSLLAEGMEVELRVAWEVGEDGRDALPTGLPEEVAVAVKGTVSEVRGLADTEGDSECARD